jgi:hypothetical protein
MTVRIYRSTDASAPVLNGTVAGSLITVLKACLVDGFGAGATATPAGWTLTLEDTLNKKAMFRNNSTTGSGRYFVIKDDGQQYIGQGANKYDRATIMGGKNYIDINTLETTFPRTITGANRHSDTHYGTICIKGPNANSPWILIADEYTCYLITAKLDETSFSYHINALTCFGDVLPFANVDSNPVAFVAGAMFATDSDMQYTQVPGGAGGIDGHIENSIVNVGESTTYYGLLPDYWAAGSNILVEAYANGTNGYYIPWVSGGSPITGGLVLSRIGIAEDPAAAIRSYTHSNPEIEKFAYYPGFYRCGHIIGTSTYKIGDDLDIVQANGRDYLLMSLSNQPQAFINNRHSFAFDITGPWR